MRDDRLREEIRSRIELVEVVGDYVTLKRSGANYTGLCPFHDDKHPSFSVSPRLQRYRCWSCGAAGDVFKFLMEMEKLTFPEALKRLADRAGVRYDPHPVTPEQATARARQFDLQREAARHFHELLRTAPSAQIAREVLRQRGVTEEAVTRFQLGYAPNAWEATLTELQRRGFTRAEMVEGGLAIAREGGEGAYDRFRHRLMFPICDAQGRVIAFGGRALGAEDAKYLNSPETPLFSKGQTLYGLHLAATRIREREAALLCEGYLDLIALHQHGFEHAVATLGTSLTTANLRNLRRFTRQLLVCFDGDSAGMNAVLNSAPLFEQQEVAVRVVELPREDDPDTFLRTKGSEAFAERLTAALPLVDYRIERLGARFPAGDDSSRQQLVAAVLPVLLGIGDHTTLEAQIVKVAQRWSGGDLRRAQSIELALKQEVKRRRVRAARTMTGADTTGAEPAGIPEGSARVPGYVQGERQLLALALQDLSCARRLFLELPPNEFTEETNRDLALRLHAFVQTTQEKEMAPVVAQRFVEELPQGSAALASDLFLSPTRMDERAQRKVIGELRARHARRRLTETLQEVRREVEAGTCSSAEVQRTLKPVVRTAKGLVQRQLPRKPQG